MESRTYWLDLFSPTTWQEFLNAGGSVSGFRPTRWRAVQQIKRGDYLLCYLTQLSRFVGVLEVMSEPYQDADRTIWKDEDFPSRLAVRVVMELSFETAIPIIELSDRLSIFRNPDKPKGWSGHVRGSPTRWKRVDGEAVVQAIQEAVVHPVVRPVDLPSSASDRRWSRQRSVRSPFPTAKIPTT